MQQIKLNEQKLNKSMFLQCLVLYVGICAGLWISQYFLLLVAGITIAVSLFGRIESSFYHLFFCLPFAMIYKLSPTSTSLFTYVMLAVCIILLYRIRRLGGTQLLLTMLFAIYALLGMGDNITTVIKMVMGILLFNVFVKRIKPLDFKNHILAFSLGMVGSSFIGCLKGNWARLDMYYTDLKSVYVGGERLLRFTGLYLDPNYYSVSVIFAVMLCLLLFCNRDGNRVLLGGLIGGLSIFGLISYSKMFVLTFLLVVLFFLFREIRSRGKMLMTFPVLLIGGTALYKWMQNNNYFLIMAKRFFKGDISTGRFDIWRVYLEHINNSPITLLFGDGLGADYLSVGGPHNTYLEIIFFIGIFGGILFLFTLLSVFKCKKYDNKRNILNYSIPLLFCVMAATLGCLTINELMFYCMLMWIGLNYGIEN